MKKTCLFFVALLFSASVNLAQDGQRATFGEVVDVEIVNVEVWVTDNQGRPVSGLTLADFELREDGKPVEISYFSEVSGAFTARGPQIQALEEPAVEETAPAAAAPSEAGHLVIYFDELHLGLTSRKRLVKNLRSFLAAEDIPPERVLVLRQGGNLLTEVPFGSDWKTLDSALQKMAKGQASGGRTELDKVLSIQRLQQLWEEAQVSTPAIAETDPCGDFVRRAFNEIEVYARNSRTRIDATLGHLTDTASFLAGVPGTKTLLYLSDALETNPGMDLRNFVFGLCPTGSDRQKNLDSPVELGIAFQDLTRHANANRVTIYALQGSTLRTSSMNNASSAAMDIRASSALSTAVRAENRSGLNTLAGETGGRTVSNKNDFKGALDRISQDMSSYYSLAYTPSHGGDGSQHRIDVNVKQRGLQVRHRKGYRDKSPDERMAERVQSALYLGQVSNPLEARLGAGNIVATENAGSFNLPLHVVVPADKLVFLPQQDASMAKVKIQVATRSANKRKVALQQRVFTPTEPAAKDQSLNLVFNLELEEGVHVLAVGLRDEITRETSYVSTAIEIREPEAGR